MAWLVTLKSTHLINSFSGAEVPASVSGEAAGATASWRALECRREAPAGECSQAKAAIPSSVSSSIETMHLNRMGFIMAVPARRIVCIMYMRKGRGYAYGLDCEKTDDKCEKMMYTTIAKNQGQKPQREKIICIS